MTHRKPYSDRRELEEMISLGELVERIFDPDLSITERETAREFFSDRVASESADWCTLTRRQREKALDALQAQASAA